MRRLIISPQKGSAEAFREFAELLRELLAHGGNARLDARAGRLRLRGTDGKAVVLPPVLIETLVYVADGLERRERMAVIPVKELLTTTEAAELLNVSRPYFTRLLEQHELPFEMVGTHHRVRLGDVLTYLEVKDAQRRGALDEIVRQDEERGF